MSSGSLGIRQDWLSRLVTRERWLTDGHARGGKGEGSFGVRSGEGARPCVAKREGEGRPDAHVYCLMIQASLSCLCRNNLLSDKFDKRIHTVFCLGLPQYMSQGMKRGAVRRDFLCQRSLHRCLPAAAVSFKQVLEIGHHDWSLGNHRLA